MPDEEPERRPVDGLDRALLIEHAEQDHHTSAGERDLCAVGPVQSDPDERDREDRTS